jgi:hypothetical protein
MKNERRAGQGARMAGLRNSYKTSIRKNDEMTNYFGILGVMTEL